MTDREEIYRPVGIVSQPNEFNYYVNGALEHAINCVMRNPAELGAAPSMFSSLNAGPANNTMRALVPLASGHVYELSVSAGGAWSITELANAVPLTGFASLTGLFSNTGRITPIVSKDRMLLNSNNGVLVGDNLAPTTGPQRALRLAGLPQLSWRTASFANGTAPDGAIPSPPTGQGVFGYQAIHTRTFSDGYKIVSVPTPVAKQFTNVVGFARTITISVQWATTDVAVAGDVIELYRTDGLAIGANANSALANSDPPAVFKQVAARTLTAADIAAGFFSFVDTARMGDFPLPTTSGVKELYTNPGNGAGGATAENRQPPLAAVMFKFDGRVFYANTTDRPKMQVGIPAGLGVTNGGVICDTPYWRANGIGTRHVTATLTNGSTVITGASAAQLSGIVPGMLVSNTQPPTFSWLPATPRVVSVNVGAGTITMSSVWNSPNQSGALTFVDALYIGFNNTLTMPPYSFGDPGDLMGALAGRGYMASPANLFEVHMSCSAYLGAAGTTALPGFFNPNVSLSLEPRNHGSGFVSMQVMATNGANYAPPLAEYTASPTVNNVTQFARTTRKNYMTWGKDQQPEHVNPGNNETFVGQSEIIAAVATKDSAWIACLDGVFRLYGQGGQYQLVNVSDSMIICAPGCMTVLNEDVYMYSNLGMMMLNNQQRDNLTDLIIGDRLDGPVYAEVPTMQLVANESDLELVYLDVASADRLWLYATKEGAGWTTLENNTKPGPLANITALAFQRTPASGIPRVLVGASPLAGAAPNYAGWGNTASFLTMDFMYQPIYAGAPMALKQWIEASFIFHASNAGKTMRPVWNSVGIGSATVVQYQSAAYARAGVPRTHSVAQTLAPGADSITGSAPQARFLGLSVVWEFLGMQAKQRT